MKKVLMIAYTIEDGEIYYFVPKCSFSKLNRFPTGKVGDNHKDEADWEAALREFGEELRAEFKNFFFSGLKFQFENEGKVISESVFGFELSTRQLSPDPGEIEDFRFMKIEEAQNALYWPNHKKVLSEFNDIVINKKYPKIFILCGPGGVGKDTIAREVLGDFKEIEKVKTATTRPRRAGETDERVFLSIGKFKEKEKNNDFIETNFFNNNWYGTLKENVYEVLGCGKSIIMDIDLNGLEHYQDKYTNTCSIFIKSDLKDLRERLIERKADDIKTIENRLKIANIEIQRSGMCDYTVENIKDKLDETINQVKEIIKENL